MSWKWAAQLNIWLAKSKFGQLLLQLYILLFILVYSQFFSTAVWPQLGSVPACSPTFGRCPNWWGGVCPLWCPYLFIPFSAKKFPACLLRPFGDALPATEWSCCASDTCGNSFQAGCCCPIQRRWGEEYGNWGQAFVSFPLFSPVFSIIFVHPVSVWTRLLVPTPWGGGWTAALQIGTPFGGSALWIFFHIDRPKAPNILWNPKNLPNVPIFDCFFSAFFWDKISWTRRAEKPISTSAHNTRGGKFLSSPGGPPAKQVELVVFSLKQVEIHPGKGRPGLDTEEYIPFFVIFLQWFSVDRGFPCPVKPPFTPMGRFPTVELVEYPEGSFFLRAGHCKGGLSKWSKFGQAAPKSPKVTQNGHKKRTCKISFPPFPFPRIIFCTVSAVCL